jgi:hypothetical protein
LYLIISHVDGACDLGVQWSRGLGQISNQLEKPHFYGSLSGFRIGDCVNSANGRSARR